MANESTRRHLLGVSGAVLVTGCLDTDDSAETNGEGQAEPTDETTGDGEETANEANTDEADAAAEPAVHEDYETTEVRAVTTNGDELGAVTAAIADTEERRYLGLSATDELPSDRGMLFVYESVEERTFVMREMEFGIDIVYADDDGTITDIHHAPAPDPDEDGSEQRYPGRGQYVLEVVHGWTSERDVSEGGVLAFDLDE